jgi:tetratricopeptide (TPR) repeat protein
MKTRTIYTLDQSDVQKHVGNNVIFQRAYGYHRQGRVIDIEIHDDVLRARVTGSHGNQYKVEAWCEDGELFSTCTCPYDWSVCKHVVAALLAWIHRRADSQSYTQITTVQWRDQLEAIPPSLLIDHIVDEMRVDLLLERYVKRWVDKLSPEKLPNLISELFRRTNSPIELEHALKRIARILTWSELLPPEQAINIAAATLKQIQTRPDLLQQASVTELIKQSIGVLRTYAPQTAADAASKHAWLKLLISLIELQTPAWHNVLTDTLLELAECFGERSFLIDEVRKKSHWHDRDMMRLLARLYKLEGRMDDYAAAQAECLNDEAGYLDLFAYYVEDNRPDEAMRLGEQGMKQLGAGAAQLAERLTALYLEWGERELARKHLIRCFDYWPSESLLKQIESLSQNKKDWKTEFTRLQKKLKAKSRAV